MSLSPSAHQNLVTESYSSVLNSINEAAILHVSQNITRLKWRKVHMAYIRPSFQCWKYPF